MGRIGGVDAAVAVLGAAALLAAAEPSTTARAAEEPATQTAPQQPAAPQGPEAQEQVPARRPIGLMLHVGQFAGFGGGVQVGTRDAGLRASVGWTPFLHVITKANQTNELRFESTLMVAPDAYVRIATARQTTHLGLQAGYRYNSLLGHGLAAGGYVEFSLGKMEGLVSGGFLIFPDGPDRVRRDQNMPGLEFAFPGPAVNFGVSVGVIVFP